MKEKSRISYFPQGKVTSRSEDGQVKNNFKCRRIRISNKAFFKKGIIQGKIRSERNVLKNSVIVTPGNLIFASCQNCWAI